jgi:hypothetical protein
MSFFTAYATYLVQVENALLGILKNLLDKTKSLINLTK